MKSTEIEISISEQKLFLIDNKSVIKTYLISSSKYGEGSKVNSFKTPLGKHVVKRKIGKDMPLGARFIGRRIAVDVGAFLLLDMPGLPVPLINFTYQMK